MARIYAFLLALLTPPTTAMVILPHPEGPFGTGYSEVQLTDRSRRDPFAAAAGLMEYRHLMVSSFYPTVLRKECEEITSPYMPKATAVFYDKEYGSYGISNSTFASLRMTFCCRPNHHNTASPDFPIVLFSPGLGNSRLIYSAMAQSLASEGYIVLTVDHPYDADIVEFWNGSFVLAANITTDEQVESSLQVRVQDISYVLNQLQSRQTSVKLLGGYAGTLPYRHHRYSVFGHSLGGATAAIVASQNPALAAAINLDGTFFGSIVFQGANHPLAIVAHDNKTLTTDPSWSSVWDHTRNATKIAIQISDTAHGSFTDFPLIVDALQVPQSLRSQLAPLIGSAPGSQVQEIVSTVVRHFTSYANCLRKNPLPPLNGVLQRQVRLLGKVVNERQCK